MQKEKAPLTQVIFEAMWPFILLYTCLLSAPYLFENILALKLPVEHFTLFEEPNYPLIYARWIFSGLAIFTFAVIFYVSIRMYFSKRIVPYWEMACTYIGAVPFSLLFLLATSMIFFGK